MIRCKELPHATTRRLETAAQGIGGLPWLACLVTLLHVGPTAAIADGTALLRYGDIAGPVSVSVSHEIEILTPEPVDASREMRYDLTLSPADETGHIHVAIDAARASSTAHGMTQRIGTSHLPGRGFTLALDGDGRALVLSDEADAPGIDLGPMVEEPFSIGAFLVDVLPVLPPATVAVDDGWTTDGSTRGLEGWTWTTGSPTGRSQVVSIQRRDGVVVDVETRTEGSLEGVAGGRSYTGTLERTTRWSFDATSGRLLSLSMDQMTDGLSKLGPKELPVTQRSRVTLKPTTPGGTP